MMNCSFKDEISINGMEKANCSAVYFEEVKDILVFYLQQLICGYFGSSPTRPEWAPGCFQDEDDDDDGNFIISDAFEFLSKMRAPPGEKCVT